jgi:hypothetical protein
MSHVARRRKLNHSTSRTLAALLGSLPVAVGSGIALGAVLPLPLADRYLVGNYSVFPIWVALACAVFLAESARRAWFGLLGALAAAALVALVGLGLR